jgi:NADPH:quinone reductase-like Zn-dependent oxidoreductase
VRAVVITQTGGPEVLQVQQRPDPQPGRGEVLIDVHAAGVNFADLLARMGLYPDAPKLPAVVGYEVAGVVAALGEGVEGSIAVGQRVVAPTHFGGYAEKAVAQADGVVAIPDALDFERAAAIPITYATAWEALVRVGDLRPGERVLIHAAAGGVGIAATQLAKRLGAEIWGTASAGKHDAIIGFGVDHALDYTRAGWHRSLPSFDVILDSIGGASWRRSYKQLRAGGRLVCYGASSVMSGEKRNLIAAGRMAASMPRFTPLRLMGDSKSVLGLNVLRLWDEFGSAARWRGPLREYLADGTIQPVLARAFGFEQAGDAHRFISERRNVGKVVLVP